MNKSLFSLALASLFISALLPGGASIAAPVEGALLTSYGPTIFKDIFPGGTGSGPMDKVVYKGKLYFGARDKFKGWELWVSDGTPAGTSLVKDINPFGHAFPYELTVFNGKIYFAANNGNPDSEFFVSDGTAAGTKRVKNINPNDSSYIAFITEYNGKLYFQANDGVHGMELWESDGTKAGTKLFKDILPGDDEDSSDPSYLTVLNGRLYFAATDSANGTELWESDGTDAGTKIVKDINPGLDSSNPIDLAVYNGKLYFGADDGAKGAELWESDGTDGGTVRVKDINSGLPGSDPWNFIPYNGKLYFSADDGGGKHNLWVTNGSAAGTKKISTVKTGANSSYYYYMKVYNGKLYFKGKKAPNAEELWVTNGTSAGTKMVKDINPGGFGSFPSYMEIFDGKLFFSASDGSSGEELWTYKTTHIFSDGFETGDTSAWTNTNVAGLDGNIGRLAACTALCVDGPSALKGGYGLRVNVLDQEPHFLLDANPDKEARYRARFNVKMGNFNLGVLDKFTLFEGRKKQKTAFLLQIRKKGTKFQIRALIKTDGGRMLRTKWTGLPKSSTVVEVAWKRAKSKTKHNGYVKLYVNDALRERRLRVNNDTFKITTVRLGVAKKLGASVSASGAFLLDAFVSDSLDYIGP